MFIAWCNENEGFFSLILSIIAIVISIIAIKAQNKGVVFEKRLRLYTDTYRIYKKCNIIVQVCPGKEKYAQKNEISSVLFRINSREAEILSELKNEAENRPSQLLDEYISIYIESYMKENERRIDDAYIFYQYDIAHYLDQLFSYYDYLLAAVPTLEKREIDKWIEEVKKILDVIDRGSILKKMRRKMPI